MCAQPWHLGPDGALHMSRKERKANHLGDKGMWVRERWASLFIYLPSRVACGILVPRPGIESGPQQ